MKQILLLVIAAIVVFVGAGFTVKSLRNQPVNLESGETMKITSTVFEDNQDIPLEFTCDGENINPPLSFSDIPQDSKSLVLIVDDPDSPTGIWSHWLLWNIPVETTTIAPASVPSGSVEGVNSFMEKKYGGPCPGDGKHHYRFRAFALDTTLELPETSKQVDLEQAMQGHIKASGTLTGLYQRQP